MRGNLEIFPLLLGLESEEGYQQVSSLTETSLKNCKTNSTLFSLPFNTSVWLSEEPLL
jgi:hypothetical protein